jgi:cell division protein FtsW
VNGRWWRRAERSSAGAAKRRRASARRGGARGRDDDARRRDRARRRATATPAAAKVVGPLDGGVVASTAILASIGIVTVYSATAPLTIGSAVPPHFLRHLAAVAGGLLCIAVVFRVPMTFWRRLALPLWALGVALLVFTAVAGIEVNGARRWIAIPGVGLRLQAAEFAKWSTVLVVAAMSTRLSDRRNAPGRSLQVAAGLTLLPVGLLLLQPDFGSAAVLIALVGLLLFVAGMPLRALFLLAFAAGAGAAGYIAISPYALARLRGFLDPWATAGREGFQLVQSFVAFGRGGGLGVGIGDGRQKLFFLPEAHTDFVLSVVAEEFGLVGLLVVLGAFAALVVAGTRVAGRARDPFCRLVAFGMTAFIALPAAVNAAVVMGLLPTTGFTLPFISFGANSLIVCSIAVGVLLRIASHEVPPPRRRVASASPRGLLHT